MKKPSTCTRCSIAFTYEANDRSGKFCSFDCWTKYKQENMQFKRVKVNGYSRTVYEITCSNCGRKKDAVRKAAKYCGTKCQLEYEYKSNTRDRITTTAAAHIAVQQYGQPKLRGIKKPPKPLAERLAISRGKMGKPVPLLRGENHWNWKGGRSANDPRNKLEYTLWRRAVFERDKYICIECGYAKGKILEADHIRPVHLFPELIYDVDNGRTLCKPCHKKTPTWGYAVTKMKRKDFDLAA